MLSTTNIDWTEKTWNPVTGCTKISPGCLHCYAERMAHRCQCMGLAKYKNNFELTIHPDTLQEPLKIKKPTMIFVNSMSDLFHKDVPLGFIQDVFDVMGKAKQHTFQVLSLTALMEPAMCTPNGATLGGDSGVRTHRKVRCFPPHRQRGF